MPNTHTQQPTTPPRAAEETAKSVGERLRREADAILARNGVVTRVSERVMAEVRRG